MTHSLFADDTIYFGNSIVDEAIQIKQVLDKCFSTLGLKFNTSKSKIYVFNTKEAIKEKIIKLLGFKQTDFPCAYLGIPFFKGPNKATYWVKVIEILK